MDTIIIIPDVDVLPSIEIMPQPFSLIKHSSRIVPK